MSRYSCQQSHDRNELKTSYTDSFETVKHSKWANKIWKTGNINRERVSCDNSGKEEQKSCVKGQDGMTKETYLDWENKNSKGMTRDRNRKPVFASDTVLAAKSSNKVCVETLKSNDVYHWMILIQEILSII